MLFSHFVSLCCLCVCAILQLINTIIPNHRKLHIYNNVNITGWIQAHFIYYLFIIFVLTLLLFPCTDKHMLIVRRKITNTYECGQVIFLPMCNIYIGLCNKNIFHPNMFWLLFFP